MCTPLDPTLSSHPNSVVSENLIQISAEPCVGFSYLLGARSHTSQLLAQLQARPSTATMLF